MFKLFIKKKNQIETEEMYPTMSAKEILLGIDMIKRRSKIDKHYATFINAYISIWARIKLWLKNIKLKFLILITVLHLKFLGSFFTALS